MAKWREFLEKEYKRKKDKERGREKKWEEKTHFSNLKALFMTLQGLAHIFIWTLPWDYKACKLFKCSKSQWCIILFNSAGSNLFAPKAKYKTVYLHIIISRYILN